MIYKFKFEVYDDNMKHEHSLTEESGDFTRAFIQFINVITKYAIKYRLNRNV